MLKYPENAHVNNQAGRQAGINKYMVNKCFVVKILFITKYIPWDADNFDSGAMICIILVDVGFKIIQFNIFTLGLMVTNKKMFAVFPT